MPRIGLLSDSHGRASTTQAAVDLLLDHGAGILLHLGDIGSVEVIDAMITPLPESNETPEAHVVFGNADWDTLGLSRYASSLGVIVDHPVGKLQFGQDTLIFLHGHESADMNQALAEHPRWLCHGHSHRKLDQQNGPVRVINPGALFRASQYTVAILDTETDNVEFLEVACPQP